MIERLHSRKFLRVSVPALAVLGVCFGMGVVPAGSETPAAIAAPVTNPAPAGSAVDGAALLNKIRQYHGELKSLVAVMQIQHENNDALAKISPDFAQFVRYGFKDFKYYFKSPDKVRIESQALLFKDLRGISVRSGGQKNFYIPALAIHKSADVTGQANKKETGLDFGVMTGDLWDDYRVWFMRSETDAGKLVYVIGLQPKLEPHGGTMVVRADAETLKILERDRYSMEGTLTQRQLFADWSHPLPHVYIPKTIKLYNNEGQFGGDLMYSQIQVNTPLADSLFQ